MGGRQDEDSQKYHSRWVADLNRTVQVSYLEKVVLNQLKTLPELSLTSGKDTADRIARADRKKPRRMLSI